MTGVSGVRRRWFLASINSCQHSRGPLLQAATDAADFELKGAQWSQAVDVRGLQNAMAQRGPIAVHMAATSHSRVGKWNLRWC